MLQSTYVTGLVLVDIGGEAGRARAQAEADLRNGPSALEPETVETTRYGLTDALDDLADADDPLESLAAAGVVLNAAADLLFDHHRAWAGAHIVVSSSPRLPALGILRRYGYSYTPH
ncbi:hypothetical protein [Streptomyces sp. NPDC056227]|uniref:hypothetical protein n=1 Tax=Streptomyces sp. NPDC056227 TaxID=3345753 RepID=UPI0035DDD011